MTPSPPHPRRAYVRRAPANGRDLRQHGIADVEQHTFPRSLALHLVPGAVVAALFYVTAPAIMNAGYPAIAAGMLAAAIGVVGGELGWLLFQGHQRTGRWSVSAVLPYRPGPFTWRKAALVLGLLVWQLVIAATVGGLKGPIAARFFSWVPAWAIAPLPPNVGDTATPGALIVTAAGLLLINVILGPFVEELYFRGYLLPRLGRFGQWAPLLNIVQFSLYHFWTPWDFVTRTILLLPLGYAVWRTRDIRIGIAAHAGINGIGYLSNALPTLLAT